MEYLKKSVGKILGVIVFNGALYTIIKLVFYIVGVLYLQGLLNTLGINYSFVRMDDYNFYIKGGFLTFNASHAKVIYICTALCVLSSIIFLFTDAIYWLKKKFSSKLNDEKFKLMTLSFLLYILGAMLFFIASFMVIMIDGSYQKGVNEALNIIKEQPLKNKDKEGILVTKEIKLKTGEILSGKLIGCSPSQCIIYSNNKAFTLEKDKIESLVSHFENKS